jgi:predicted ATPase
VAGAHTETRPRLHPGHAARAFYLPEIHRLGGECLLSLDHRNKAEALQAFTTARDDARQQGATLFELRASARLAEMSK